MKRSNMIALALLTGLASTGAMAQGSEAGSPSGKAGTTFWIDHNVLTWSSNKASPENGNDKKDSSLQTTPDDVTLGIFWKNWGIRVQPNNTGGAVGLSLFPQRELEVGALLGINHTNSETDNGPESETKSNTFGVFGNYYMPLDSFSTLEFLGRLVYGKTKTEQTVANVTTTSTEKSTSLEFGVQYAYQISEHFHLIPGVFFHTGSSETDAGGTSSEDDATGLTLNLAHFRYTF